MSVDHKNVILNVAVRPLALLVVPLECELREMLSLYSLDFIKFLNVQREMLLSQPCKL